MNVRPIVIDLFSGAGGLSLGFEQAGFDVVAAVEIDPIHAAIHKYNFPYGIVLPTSVIYLSATTIREQAGIGDDEINVVVGGPPCQGFSLIGKRSLDDPRNRLVREFVRLVEELSPQFFLFENVKGLTVGKHRQVLEELVEQFHGIGYNVQMPWQVLNAMNYRVPQDRERLFLLGARQGISMPSYPSPITEPLSSLDLEIPGLLAKTPTCKDALGDLPDAELFEELKDSDAVHTNKWGIPSDYGKEMRCISEKAWHFGYPRKWEPNLLTSSARTNHTNISRRRFSQTQPGSVEPVSRFFKLSPEGISNTLRAGTDSARGAFTSPRPIHYEKNRCITVREMARLHGFPDWFRFHTTKWHGARQIGNAVPPPLARAIAAEFIRAAGIEVLKPKELIQFGERALLEMDMTEAANFWGIDVPVAKRDRKSGAKKRKQEEIEALHIGEMEI